MLSQLQPEMDKKKVRFIMGTPIIHDTFNQDRWDYSYVMRNGRQVLEQNTLTVFFEGDELVRVEGDLAPSDPAPSEEPS